MDLSTPVPLDPDADLSVLDEAKILAAPDDPDDRSAWRAALCRWRDEARGRVRFVDGRYAETTWPSQAWNVAMVWLWDEAVYDWGAPDRAGRHDPDRLLKTYEPFGGLDAVVLWHAYPVIGIDPRNQFDWYRDVPGLDDLVAALQRRGTRVFLDYNPWDVGTHRASGSDAQELASLLTQTGADGLFLDTLKEGDPELLRRLEALDPPPVLAGESRVPLARIVDHQASWAQWFADSEVPGVLRARWFEQRHMMHHIRRWNRDHSAELQSAWVNGAGVLIWDVVFGVWVGWNDQDLATRRAMRRTQLALGEHLVHGEWEPLTDLAPQATAAGVHGSRWTHRGSTLWTVVNRGEREYVGPLLPQSTGPAGRGARFIDVVTGRDSDEPPTVRIPGRGVGGVLLLPPDATEPVKLSRLLADAGSEAEREYGTGNTDFPRRLVVRMPVEPAYGEAPTDAIVIPAGRQQLPCTWRQRETGMYEETPYVNDWKPLPPRLHGIRTGTRDVELDPTAVDAVEVSNADFAAFLDASGYRPQSTHRFLAHWVDGRPSTGKEDEPVTFVDLDDARAYAGWRGARLATEDEWQVAAGGSGWRRSEPLVWSWTDSEHSDGRTRWVVLKGGSWWSAQGSEWYVDGGPREPEWSLRLLLTGGGLARSECIGFRCAVDLAPGAT